MVIVPGLGDLFPSSGLRGQQSGVLLSTGSITVNTFLVRRAGTQGRWRVALMQYLTLPCLPSKEVTSVLGMDGR